MTCRCSFDVQSRFFILPLLCILCAPFIAIHAASTPNVISFDDFLSEFPPPVQIQAQTIWDSIETRRPSETGVTTTAEISDEDLFASLDIKNKESILAQLRERRVQLARARMEYEQALRTANQWKQFSDRIASVPDMGRIYLQSLRMAALSQERLREKKEVVLVLEKKIESLRVNASLNAISRNFTGGDWLVIGAYLVLTTVLGGLLAGKQADMKDFFLGGRKLPWTAVCGSIIATEISAATFLIAPAIVFSQGGDMTYIQLALGTILARFIIGYFFIPVYYKHEIYSPYDYMGRQLGPRVKNITTFLFMIGGILAQGARVYIAAKALQVITGTNTTTSILIIGAISIAWTIMGGITTVIWTDAIQFLLFSFGAVAALAFVVTAVDGGITALLSQAYHAGKLRAVNLNFNPKEAYTLWCGLIGFSFLTLSSHGTDQLLVQRMFTCKNQEDARKAVVFSGVSQVLTYLLLFVGAGVFIYYKHYPLTEPEQVVVTNDSMKIFAIYIVNVMPPLLSGLMMAAIFATAISTLDSLLAALAQSTISVVYKPLLKPEASERHYVLASRFIVLVWGILLTGFAILCNVIAQSYTDLIQFALAMAAYTYGALLGTFLLAFLPTRRDDRGLLWGVPLSMLLIFALNWHQAIAQWIVLLVGLFLMLQAFGRLRHEPQKVLYIGLAVLLVLIVGMAVIGTDPEGQPIFITLAWPWHFPIGTAMTFVIGILVGNTKEERFGTDSVTESFEAI
ncbi:MAG: sodium:solute symporter [Sedimentisphaerales bacterium]|nr:sodium:solute symporter [Sedimentisphaerales bacterium]